MHPKDRLLRRRCFSRTSNGIWQECHIPVDSKSQDEKLHPSSGFKTSVVVLSPLEYIRKLNKSKILKGRIVESLLPQLGNSSRSTEKLGQGTSTLFTAMLNNG